MGDTTVNALPFHPTLVHPRTGEPLRAVGVINGRVIWPILGGAEAAAGTPPAGQQTPPNPAPPNGATPQGNLPPAGEKPDEPLGPAGLKALQAERDRADRFEKELKALEPLKRVAAALGNGDEAQGKSEVEQLNEKFAKYEQELVQERQERWKAELANEFGLTAAQAKRLIGTTRDEMKADAEQLVKDFEVKPKGASSGPARPKPDRSQGGGGSNGHVSAREQGLEQARRRGFLKDKTTT